MVTLATDGPFDLLGTVRLLQRRPTHPVERFVEGGYQRVHATASGWVELRVEDHGTIDRPFLRLSFPRGAPPPGVVRELEKVARRTLGLDTDVRAFWEEARKIPPLAALGWRMRGMRPPRFSGLLEAIVSTVPFQQMSLDSGMAVFTRLIQRLQPQGLWAPVFPEAGLLAGEPEATFTGIGFSRAKARALHDAAEVIGSGALTGEEIESLPTLEAASRLEKLRGIGPWSSHLILLRGYGRLDSFPPGDAGVRRGLEKILGERLEPERWAGRFGPLAGMLYFTSLGAALLKSGVLPQEPGEGGALGST